MALVHDDLVARPIADVVTPALPLEGVRVILASLARGGAERIVIDWLSAESRRGRAAELAVLHPRRQEYAIPAGIAVMRRGAESVEDFVDALGSRWKDSACAVSTHLVPDALLARLWAFGVRTVPVIHNAREGWRNDPSSWPGKSVPLAIACADSVRLEAEGSGCRVPLAVVRHRPGLGALATDATARARIREEWGIAPDTFVVGAVGAFKAQKDHGHAVEVLAALRRTRKACLVILGGALDRSGFAQIDRVVSRAADLGVGDSLRLPGFVDPVEPWYAAFDALLNVSRHEGFSMATQEALAAGLPVVATDVGGQSEARHPNLELLPANSSASAFAARLAKLPVRRELRAEAQPRFPRAWSLTTCWRRPAGAALDTLFVTANLNAGGAQRSLVNLARRIVSRHRLAIAVCGESTHPAFPARLAAAGVECFRPAATADPFACAEGILARATSAGARTICFWNADARVKLLASCFAPPGLRLLDVSPGAYAYRELEGAADLAHALAFGPAEYYRRLDGLVTKFDDPSRPACARVEVIPNGVARRDVPRELPLAPRFLVSGRIAPSKRFETILEAFGRLSRRYPCAQLDIIGQAESRHLGYLERIVSLAGGTRVEFRGACPDLQFLDEPYTAAVVLGTHQGCPNAVLEAMAAGLAVIANDSGGTRELVRHGETGWLLREECTSDELALALEEAAADPERARRFGRVGRDDAARDHSLEGMAMRYLSLLDDGAATAPQPKDAIPHGFARLHAA